MARTGAFEADISTGSSHDPVPMHALSDILKSWPSSLSSHLDLYPLIFPPLISLSLILGARVSAVASRGGAAACGRAPTERERGGEKRTERGGVGTPSELGVDDSCSLKSSKFMIYPVIPKFIQIE